MKIFISSDMEGTAGVVSWEQCRPGQQDYEHYRSLLQDEVNAAIDGANQAGGPHEFLVNDSHGKMVNLFPEQLKGEPDKNGPTVVQLVDDDPIRLYRTFVTLVLLTRGIAE
jgi:D-aminopeptidase